MAAKTPPTTPLPDPLGPEWEHEFFKAHGREPRAEDKQVRLFSLSYPDQWPEAFVRLYGERGLDQPTPQSLASLFTATPERSWDNLPAALSRLSEWYPNQEDALIRDIGTLYAGLQPRAPGRPFPMAPQGIDAVLSGQTLPNVQLSAGNFPLVEDADANVHHWAWALNLARTLGTTPAIALNLLREYATSGSVKDMQIGGRAASAVEALGRLKHRRIGWESAGDYSPMPVARPLPPAPEPLW